MKKITLITFFTLGCAFLASAQNPIPNPSFENWTTYASGDYPTGWQTSDSVYQLLGAPRSVVSEAVDKCHLLLAAKLTTQTVLVTNRVPGMATNGNIIVQGISNITYSGGSPDTARSAVFTGCYKYTPSSTDTAVISAVLYKRNASTGNRDTIAYATFMPSAAVGSMTNFSQNFTYVDYFRQPDSIFVLLLSSPGINRGTAGSTLIVDNLNVTGYVGINERNATIKNVKIFPSPANAELNIEVDFTAFNKNLVYEMMDETGRIVSTGMMREKNKINTASFANGIYMIALKDESGAKVYSSKVTVAH